MKSIKKTLYQLDKEGLKDKYSARKDAVIEFIKHGNYMKSIEIKDIPKWEGEYQNV
ncbi:hypothetical protein D3C72_2562750 [compost metagenome]